MPTKVCSTCNKTKPKTTEYFLTRNTKNGKKLRASCRECQRIKSKLRIKGLEDKINNYSQRNKYKLSIEEYEKLMSISNCECCNIEFIKIKGKRNPRCIDHCHNTNMIRGVLCNGCNTAIGKLGDSIEGLQKAINYLNKTL